MMILCVGTCVFSEWLFNVIGKRFQSVGDLSAVVTGMILSLNLPPVVPFYVPIVGGFFAIVIVKMLFGGIGKTSQTRQSPLVSSCFCAGRAL